MNNKKKDSTITINYIIKIVLLFIIISLISGIINIKICYANTITNDCVERIDRRRVETVTVDTIMWRAGTVLEERIKKEEFLGLWKNDNGVYEEGKLYDPNGIEVKYKMPDSEAYKNPASNIVNAPYIFFDLLATTQRASKYEKPMRYLLWVYTGKNYGITNDNLEELFDLFNEESNATQIGGGTEGNISYETLSFTDEDIEILYKITHCERGNGNQQQQEHVVSVILNRVLYPNGWGNTVRDVVFGPYQFSPCNFGGSYYSTTLEMISQTTKDAVDNVIANGDTTGGCTYFMTPPASRGLLSDPSSWLHNCDFKFNDGDGSDSTHNFYTKADVLAVLQQYIRSSSNTSVSPNVENLIQLNERGAWELLLGRTSRPMTSSDFSEQEAENLMESIDVRIRTWVEPNNIYNLETKTATKRITVNKHLKEYFISFFNTLYDLDPNFVVNSSTTGAYNYRNVRGQTKLSPHSFGGAIDINWDTAGNGMGDVPYTKNERDNLPETHTKYETIYYDSPITRLATQYTLDWGGNWRRYGTYCDGMHFSYVGDSNRSQWNN